MSEIIIREARPGDGVAMAAYVERILAEKLDTILIDRPYTAEEEEATIRLYQEKAHFLFLLAMDGDTVVGMLDIRSGERAGNRHAGAFGMSVAADHRGQGLGRRLLERAIAEAKSWPGFCRLELGVTPWNAPAIELYSSLGFVLEGVKKKGINLRGQPEDDLFMALVW